MPHIVPAEELGAALSAYQRRREEIELIGDRDGWRCGICHQPAEHLYYIELHDDATLCCAVCAQVLEAGALS